MPVEDCKILLESDVSSKVLAAIGNPFRFNSASQVLKMAGMDLNANRSGNIKRHLSPHAKISTS
ncbi:MAG: transposase [Deltaproteobacteria bacterium]|nr:transposase [Deltaproteobacteria bacterium]